MQYSRLKRFSISAVSVLTLSALAAPAAADGLQSQFKTRLPVMPGYVRTLTERQKMNAHGAPKHSKPTDETAVIGMIVRRNNRAAQRRVRWFGETKEEKISVQEVETPVHEGNRVDRSQLIRRGMKQVPSKCAKLHTHDRAVCMYQSQLKQMTRFDVSTR